MKYVLFAAGLALAAALPATAAEDFDLAAHQFGETVVASWVQDPALIAAIAAQNVQNAALTDSDVLALDETWRADVATGSDLITGVLGNSAADQLRSLASSNAAVTEIFIMDNHGLNVAATDTTSDYWQGDEAKFSETYDVGPGTLHVSDIEFDESTQTYQVQISMTISDPATGGAIGAITVGVNPELLF